MKTAELEFDARYYDVLKRALAPFNVRLYKHSVLCFVRCHMTDLHDVADVLKQEALL